jgi:hypothetical protein
MPRRRSHATIGQYCAAAGDFHNVAFSGERSEQIERQAYGGISIDLIERERAE